jgi:hypothetical protein
MKSRKRPYVFLGIIQLIVAIGALPAGILFLTDPSGEMMGMDTEMLKNAPFSDYLIPGLILLVILGLGNAVSALFSFNRVNISGKAGVLLGAILIVWIGIQLYWMGYVSFLQVVMGIVGLLELLIGLIIEKNIRKLRIEG